MKYTAASGRFAGTKISILVLFVFAGILLNACSLPRGGRAQPIDDWKVTEYFCAGDSIIVSWNLQPGFDSRNCNISCDTARDCAVGSECLDSACINQPLPPGSPTPPAGQCPPDTELTISSSEGGNVVDHSHDSSGSVSLTPSDSVSFTANGGYRFPLRLYAEEHKTATLVTPDTRPIKLSFPFVCPIAWQDYDVAIDGPTVSEHVAIASVTNTSDYTIDLTGANYSGPAIRLAPGESSSDFNGKLTGRWHATIPAEFRTGLPLPHCLATDQSDPYPDLSVHVKLTCSVEN